MVYNYTIRKADINYLLTDKASGQKVTTGVAGTVWIDAETARFLRIEYAAANIPTDFPLTMSEHAVEYDEVKVNGKKYFLPVSSEFIVGSEMTQFYSRK